MLLKRTFMLAALLLIAASDRTFAQELDLPPAKYPELLRTAPQAGAFVPPGWALETSATGDLNSDGLDDVVMVLQEQSPQNIVENSGLGVRRLNSNPRILAVALFDRTSSSFHLAFQNHTLIPRHESPTMDDAFDKADGISVRRGGFTVTLGLFANAGGWDMGRMTFTFRMEKGSASLIGYDRAMVTRNTGKTRNLSINYATGRIRTATGSISDDGERVVWSALKRKNKLAIEDIGGGLDFDPADARGR